MIYMENIFICMAAPLLMAMLCVRKGQRSIFFFWIVGMGACLLSAYLNTFFAMVYQADIMGATTQIAPLVEEVVKLLPLLFYFVVLQPDLKEFSLTAVIIAAGFAAFENICYLTQHGSADISFLFIRGFGTGALHICSGAAYGHWMRLVWKRQNLRMLCLLGTLCLCVICHAIYNLLVSVGGPVQFVGYAFPIITVVCGWIGCWIISTRRTQQN